MILCWGTYKKKELVLVALGTKKNKVIALKVQEPPLEAVLSDDSIEKLRSNVERLMELSLEERLSEIKNLVSEWPKVYRTYNPEHLVITKRYQIVPS